MQPFGCCVCMKLMDKCPQYGGTKIDKYRMPFGEMCDMTCGFKFEDKTKVSNPIIEAA
jgi:hypothetical protein